MREAAELIIGNLNEDGYLSGSELELAESLKLDNTAEALKLLHAAREIVTQLDPAGVGVLDLRECLLRQIEVQRSELQRHGDGMMLTASC